MPTVFVLILCAVFLARSCEAVVLRPVDTLRVRLLHTICSATSRPGDPIHATIIGRIDSDDDEELSGATLVGSITKAHAVGIGIRRSRASLAIEFTAAGFAEANMVPFRGRLMAVDSARERVDQDGIIQGIDAGGAPRNRITSRLIRLPSLNPYPDLALLAFKVAAPFFPEPEIHYPQGTELFVKVDVPVTLPGREREDRDVSVPDWAERVLEEGLESRTVTAKKAKPADVINLLFAGASEDIAAAFHLAGWNQADPNGPRAVLRSIFSVIEDRSYPNAPMSLQLYSGTKPAMMWQRVLNSPNQRHHIRVWRLGDENEAPIWAASATEDIAAGFNWRSFRTFHHIDPDIDIERRKVLSDLTLTGCVVSNSIADRPKLSGRMANATGDEMFTDGRIAIVEIGPCVAGVRPLDALEHRNHGTVLSRKARKLILSLRYDVVRANAIVGAYDASRTIWKGMFRSMGNGLVAKRRARAASKRVERTTTVGNDYSVTSTNSKAGR